MGNENSKNKRRSNLIEGGYLQFNEKEILTTPLPWSEEEIANRTSTALGQPADTAKITSLQMTELIGKPALINELLSWTVNRIDADQTLTKLQISKLPNEMKALDE